MARVDPAIAAPPLRLRNHGGFLFFFFLLLLLLLLFSSVDASVHSYISEKFTPKGNAFILHGGSEGLYASLPHANATAGRGDSFIRHLHYPWRSNCITFVIALGMLEMAFWYFEYAEFNDTGLRPMGITFWAVTFGTVKRTVSWVIILVVSMGYGVVRPTLGGLTSKVIMLGATFFLASEILELVENAGAVSDFAGKARLFLVLPVALLDAFFIIWIFTSLSKTLDKLQLYFKSNDVYNGHWQNAWIIPAFWQVLSFSLLCVIAALWAPSQNSMRYAYSDDGSEDFDREDSLSLIKPGPVSSKDTRGSAGLMDARAAVSNDTTTSHDGDIEEDKRE
ncbi:hypothetical protein BHM03_00023901 [Ensete ventricosum]|nr:hypothetical protein BHM03_00023901 [Ensete ventricosum]